jgi:competence protein ComEA
MKNFTKSFAILVATFAFLAALLGTATAQAGSAEGVVNINTAGAAQLQQLPGIGSTKAKAIIEHRKTQPFKSVEDLAKVKGIGEALLSKIKNRVVVKGKTTAKAPKKK